ncbi:hypothetical protein Btru_070649 [Bulinus truncatus]|nr:hypothetical protein Btru_070649 [Bulinus truncatus]
MEDVCLLTWIEDGSFPGVIQNLTVLPDKCPLSNQVSQTQEGPLFDDVTGDVFKQVVPVLCLGLHYSTSGSWYLCNTGPYRLDPHFPTTIPQPFFVTLLDYKKMTKIQ